MTNNGEAASETPAAPTGFPASIEELGRLTNLRAFSVGDVAGLFEEFAEGRVLDQDVFCDVLRLLRGNTAGPEEANKAEACVRTLFGLFDVDRNGFVDQAELLSGLSVLCRGTSRERVQAAFKV